MKNVILASVLVFAASAMANETAPAAPKADAAAVSTPAPEASKEKAPVKAEKTHGKKAKKSH